MLSLVDIWEVLLERLLENLLFGINGLDLERMFDMYEFSVFVLLFRRLIL